MICLYCHSLPKSEALDLGVCWLKLSFKRGSRAFKSNDSIEY